MNPILRNILAVIAGILIGAFLNGKIVSMGSLIVPQPEGADLLTMEGLKASMHLMKPIHFLMPFLAHALGTFVATHITTFLAASHAFRLSMMISALFLLGGLSMVMSLPSPLWFSLLDLLGAYMPMGFLGHKLASRYNHITKLATQSNQP